MASIIKANQLQDFGGNSILTSDGAGTVTINSAQMKNTPAFLAYKSSDQTISSGSDTKITFDTELFDTDNVFSSSTFTVPSGKNGKYFIYSQVQQDTGSGATLIISVFVNGSEIFAKRTTSDAATRKSPDVSVVVDLSVSDTVEIYMYQNSGSSRTIDSAAKRTHFGGYKLIGA